MCKVHIRNTIFLGVNIEVPYVAEKMLISRQYQYR